MKKFFKIGLAGFLGLGFISVEANVASAKASQYIIKDNNGQVYAYNFAEIDDSFLDFKAKIPAPLFEDFAKKSRSYDLYAVYDQDANRYVDYVNGVEATFFKKKMVSNPKDRVFNLDQYTESDATAPLADMPAEIIEVIPSANGITQRTKKVDGNITPFLVLSID